MFLEQNMLGTAGSERFPSHCKKLKPKQKTSEMRIFRSKEKLMSLKVKLSAHCNKSEFRTFTRAWPNFLSNIQRSKNCVELHALKHHNTASYKPPRRNVYQWKDTQTHNWRGPAFWTLISLWLRNLLIQLPRVSLPASTPRLGMQWLMAGKCDEVIKEGFVSNWLRQYLS